MFSLMGHRSSKIVNKPMLPPVPSKSITITVNHDGSFDVSVDKQGQNTYEQIRQKTKTTIRERSKKSGLEH